MRQVDSEYLYADQQSLVVVYFVVALLLCIRKNVLTPKDASGKKPRKIPSPSLLFFHSHNARQESAKTPKTPRDAKLRILKTSKVKSDPSRLGPQSSHHHKTKQANPTAATMASALARTMAPGLALGPQHGRL
jgi:hypothetical protein